MAELSQDAEERLVEFLELPPMRSVFQHQRTVSHVYLGSKFHLLNELFNDINAPMYRSAKALPLGPFKPGDVATFIRERFASTGLTVSDEAIVRILAITSGHPSDSQELAHFAWEISQARGIPASPEIVDRALARIVTAEDARYTAIWTHLPRARGPC